MNNIRLLFFPGNKRKCLSLLETYDGQRVRPEVFQDDIWLLLHEEEFIFLFCCLEEKFRNSYKRKHRHFDEARIVYTVIYGLLDMVIRASSRPMILPQLRIQEKFYTP